LLLLVGKGGGEGRFADGGYHLVSFVGYPDPFVAGFPVGPGAPFGQSKISIGPLTGSIEQNNKNIENASNTRNCFMGLITKNDLKWF
jgi:hypothetical protein